MIAPSVRILAKFDVLVKVIHSKERLMPLLLDKATKLDCLDWS